MIITKLQGGLGNQLFQWATTRNLSLKYKSGYAFDLSYFSTFGSRPLAISKFKKINIPTVDRNYQVKTVHDDFTFKIIPDNSYLNGYWQSEKYFIEHEDVIKSDLAIQENEILRIKQKYKNIENNSVSLHIRRGDYLNVQHFHPNQPIDYYNDAVDLIKADNILVVSDDLVWCKENIKFKNCTFVEEDDITSIHIMSLCTNNIITNSSFSWWGAWLNLNKNKKVIAPKKWFGPSGPHYWQDIYCKDWIVL